MKDFLGPEGPLFSFLDKVGQLIVLSLVWILGCLPVVTILTSTTALYYAVMKSVRRGRGDALKEFWHSYKANLKRGIPMTVTVLVLGVLLCGNMHILQEGTSHNVMRISNMILLLLLGMTVVYVSPALSRFDMRIREIWKLAFVMAVRFLPYTAVVIAGALAVGYLQFYVLPIPAILLLPSVCCYAATFLMEKALRKYMPAKKPDEDAWYYE